MQPFSLTVLRARGKRLVKVLTASGGKQSYDRAHEFEVEQRKVADFGAFAAMLSELENRRSNCIIRGIPSRHCPHEGPVYRLSNMQPGFVDDAGRRVSRDAIDANGWQDRIGVDLYPVSWLPMFTDAGTSWLLLDFDDYEGALDWRHRLEETADELIMQLPDEFGDASCWYQATGSAADPSKPDLGGRKVRMRLGFLLSRPLTQDQLQAWLGHVPGLDVATFRTVQPIYVGRPIFVGCDDPMPVRSGVLRRLQDAVDVPDDLPAPKSRPDPYAAADEQGSHDGLLPCDKLEDALGEITSGAGKVRSGLGRAARAYIRAVGPKNVDVQALAARLAEEGLRHRSAEEVRGYNLPELVRWILRSEAAPHPAQGLIDKIKAKHLAEVEARAQARKDADGEPETDTGTGAEREEEGAQEAPRKRFEGCPL